MVLLPQPAGPVMIHICRWWGVERAPLICFMEDVAAKSIWGDGAGRLCLPLIASIVTVDLVEAEDRF